MSKLPEKLELEPQTTLFQKTADNMNSIHAKINEIIDFLTEQYKKQKPCKHELKKDRLYCNNCGLAREEW